MMKHLFGEIIKKRMYEVVDKCIVMHYNVNKLEEKNCIKLLYEFCIVTLIAHIYERVLKWDAKGI